MNTEPAPSATGKMRQAHTEAHGTAESLRRLPLRLERESWDFSMRAGPLRKKTALQLAGYPTSRTRHVHLLNHLIPLHLNHPVLPVYSGPVCMHGQVRVKLPI